jgi:flagellar motor protein MotB
MIVGMVLTLFGGALPAMGAGVEFPEDASRMLAVQEKDMLVQSVTEYAARIHEYREDRLTLSDNREWLVVRMMRFDDRKQPVPPSLETAKGRIDAKLIQIDGDMVRIEALTENHLDRLRRLDERVCSQNSNKAPGWWQFDPWIYSLMYPGRTQLPVDPAGDTQAASLDHRLSESGGAFSALRQDLEMKIKSVELEDWVALVSDGSELALEVRLPILFGAGKSDVANDYKPFFKKLAWLLKAYPVRVDVAGYSDGDAAQTASFATRMALGANRAAKVVEALIETGMPANVFKVISAGDYGAGDADAPDLGPSMKRRVDLRVHFGA